MQQPALQLSQQMGRNWDKMGSEPSRSQLCLPVSDPGFVVWGCPGKCRWQLLLIRWQGALGHGQVHPWVLHGHTGIIKQCSPAVAECGYPQHAPQPPGHAAQGPSWGLVSPGSGTHNPALPAWRGSLGTATGWADAGHRKMVANWNFWKEEVTSRF